MKLYEYYYNKGKANLVLEYCGKGEMYSYIVDNGPLMEQEAARVVRQVLYGINYAHQNGFVHRDLKPENVLLQEDGTVKIGDWASAARINKKTGDAAQSATQQTPLSEFVGTPYYVAPEVIKKRYGEKADIWSIGVLMYVLLLSYPPFMGDCVEEIYERIEGGVLEFNDSAWDSVSEEAIDLLRSMMTPDPEKRISAFQALSHPWFKNNAPTLPPNYLKDVASNFANFKLKGHFQQTIVIYIVNYVQT